MKKLKIQDLEVGKIYSAFYKGVEQEGIYKIESSGKIFENHGFGWEEAAITYNEIFNTTFEEFKRGIDWTKVPRGTKVQVRDVEETEWLNRYFVELQFHTFPFITTPCLDDNFTGWKAEDFFSRWKYCRIHPSIAIPDEWYKEVK